MATISEWIRGYRIEHPRASLSECITAIKSSGDYAACVRESLRRKPMSKPMSKPAPAIQAMLAELNASYRRMLVVDSTKKPEK